MVGEEIRFPLDNDTAMVYNAEGELIRKETPYTQPIHYLHGRKAYSRMESGGICYYARDGRLFRVHMRPEFILEIHTPGEYKNVYMQDPDPDVVGRFKTIIGENASDRARRQVKNKVERILWDTAYRVWGR